MFNRSLSQLSPAEAIEYLKQRLRALLPALSLEFGVEKLSLFGSFARQEATERSDIDILVEFNRPLGLRFVDLADVIERYLGHKVDLVAKDAVKPRLWAYIERDLIDV